MRLLLHICCAPCSTEVLKRLSKEYDVTGFFFNPNIHPREEHDARLAELNVLSNEWGFNFIEGGYDLSGWTEATKRLEEEPEGGRRCTACFWMRLERTAQMAREKSYPAFTTTLTISPHKNSEVINSIGEELGKRYGLAFIKENFKKKDGFKHSLEHSRKYGLKRQDYCGCVYSRRAQQGLDRQP